MKALRTYIILAYFITWAYVVALFMLYKIGTLSINQLNLYYAFGALGPFLASAIATKALFGKEALKRLLKVQFGTVNIKTIIISVSPLILFAVGYFLYGMTHDKALSFDVTKKQFQLTDTASYVGWALPLFTYAIFEEFGWRGFALPVLQKKYSPLRSSLILSAVWACWHAPFFLWRFNFGPGVILGFAFGILVGTVILTYLFNASNGNILFAIIFHVCFNIASGFDKDFIAAVVSTGLVFIAVYSAVALKRVKTVSGIDARQ